MGMGTELVDVPRFQDAHFGPVDEDDFQIVSRVTREGGCLPGRRQSAQLSLPGSNDRRSISAAFFALSAADGRSIGLKGPAM